MMKTASWAKGTTTKSIYQAWANMRKRCDGKSSYKSDNKNYLLRGITYCERWSSFHNFYEDMEKTYEKGLSLDRIDNNKGYSPENCRWATRKEQNNNTRANRKFTINGETMNLEQWIDRSAIKSSTVRQRFYVMKWPIEKALGFDRKNG